MNIRKNLLSVKSHRRLIGFIALLILLVLSACNFPIKDFSRVVHRYPTLDPGIFESHKTAFPQLEGTPLPGQIMQPPPVVDETQFHVYAAQSGDTLQVVAAHYDVSPLSITSQSEIPAHGIIPPGQYLVIPRTDANTVARALILPDSAVIDSPCADDFDLAGYINQANGYLARYHQEVGSEYLTGSTIVRRVADNQSVNPRLLLTFAEFRSHWVLADQYSPDTTHPLGFNNDTFRGFYQELSLAARLLNTGYYAWRNGEITSVTYQDQQSMRIPANFNPGSAALQYLFAQLYPAAGWEEQVSGANGFLALYQSMFPDPWICASQVEPLLSEKVTPPALDLPFGSGEVWAFTAGPHYSWVQGNPSGAVDFAPVDRRARCSISPFYARAVADGVVVRSDNNVVLLALTDEQDQLTGWRILYMHMAAQDVVPLGAHLKAGDPVGHPSCEGGAATGTHVHIARLYKGEWIGAGDPFPLVLGGWTITSGEKMYSGSMLYGDRLVTANPNGAAGSLISR